MADEWKVGEIMESGTSKPLSRLEEEYEGRRRAALNGNGVAVRTDAAATGAEASPFLESSPRRTGPEPLPLNKKERGTYRVFIPLTLLGSLLVTFIGWEVIQRHLFPDLSVGMRHAALTIQASLVVVFACTGVYAWMRRQRLALTRTAEQLTRVLESYQADRSVPARFENPHLVHCRDVLDCRKPDCPMNSLPGERCWQVMALSNGNAENGVPSAKIQRCHTCEVYRRSCPDPLTELGESFNNLMFLLEEESKKVGRMQAHLVEKEKMVALGQIAAGVAHEIGNPLSSISSIVQMLKRSKSTQPKTEQLDLIEIHIHRISTIVRQMVTLARPGPEQWELLDVGQTLDEAVRLISFDRRARGVEIDFERLDSLPPTYGIRGQLQQVFINLALNALDAMPHGGRLTIRASHGRDDLLIQVKDTGMGIPPEIGRRVFEPFFTTKEPGKGTGLGLAVSYGIVRKHGGVIDFESEVGRGTTVSVQLPLIKKAPDS